MFKLFVKSSLFPALPYFALLKGLPERGACTPFGQRPKGSASTWQCRAGRQAPERKYSLAERGRKIFTEERKKYSFGTEGRFFRGACRAASRGTGGCKRCALSKTCGRGRFFSTQCFFPATDSRSEGFCGECAVVEGGGRRRASTGERTGAARLKHSWLFDETAPMRVRDRFFVWNLERIRTVMHGADSPGSLSYGSVVLFSVKGCEAYCLSSVEGA